MTPRATGEPPSAICSVPPAPASRRYLAEPCTCLACHRAAAPCEHGAAALRSWFHWAACAGIRQSEMRVTCGRNAGNFGERLDDKIAGDTAAIIGAGAQISERREILLHGIRGRLPVRRVSQRQARKFSSTAFARFGIPAMPPNATLASLIRHLRQSDRTRRAALKYPRRSVC